MLKQYTKVHLQCICFFASANQKMMKVSLYLVQSGDLVHDKDRGKAKKLPPWTVQNDKEVSLYTTYIAQKHLYHFIAKIHLAQCCFSKKKSLSLERVEEENIGMVLCFYTLLAFNNLLILWQKWCLHLAAILLLLLIAVTIFLLCCLQPFNHRMMLCNCENFSLNPWPGRCGIKEQNLFENKLILCLIKPLWKGNKKIK